MPYGFAQTSIGGKTQMRLGELIDALKRQDQAEAVKYDFVHHGPTTLASYRGYYEDLALGYDEKGNYPTVAELITRLESAIGEVFTGWKGGDYTMTRDTPVWVANPGESGSTVIVGVEKHLYVTLITEMVDD